MKIQITYIGRRINGKKLDHGYLGKDSTLFFDKQLSPHTIGSIIECERTEKGVKAPYDLKGTDTARISEWSIAERADVEKMAETKRAKEKHPQHVDELIKAVKDNTMFADRRRVALYIFTKIMS